MVNAANPAKNYTVVYGRVMYDIVVVLSNHIMDMQLLHFYVVYLYVHVHVII